MTVCIVVRSLGNLVGVADRMLTSGDIQFEPSAAPKIRQVTNSIAVLQSGDAALNAEIMNDLDREVVDRIQKDPSKWLPVRDVADLYIEYRNVAKRRRTEAELLRPIGLNFDTYRDEIHKYGEATSQQLIKDLINFELPHAAVIVAGIGTSGPHIYVIDDGYISCNDTIGFAAVGIGARHAESQFMFARHSPKELIVDTALLTYIAKKRAEVAPGVGQATDMFTAGAAPGTLIFLPETTVAGFEKIYHRLRLKEEQSRDEARREANEFITKAAAKAEEISGGQQKPTTEGEVIDSNGRSTNDKKSGATRRPNR